MRLRGRERVSTAVSGWLPTQSVLPASLDPKLWLDAADASTIEASSGGVFLWRDKSGNNVDVFQPTAAQRPTTGTQSVNGLNVLDFDGGDWLTSNVTLGVSNSTNFNVFAVAAIDAANTFTTIFATGTPGVGGQAAAFQVSNIGATRRMTTDVWRPRGMYGSTTVATSTPYIFSFAVEPWSDVETACDFRLNGAPETETAYGAAATVSLADGLAWIGAFGAGLSTSRWDGQIAEVLVYDRAMTATEVGRVEQYLSNKWNIALA